MATSSQQYPTGFTVVEMMITLSIAALLAIFAVPSIRALFAQNRAATLANSFSTSVNYARSEAIKRGSFVSLCAANATQTSCVSTSTSWSNGWLVFVDSTGNGSYDSSTDTLLRTQGSFPAGTTITAPSGRITYQGNGFILSGSNTGAGTYTLKPSGCQGKIGGREITISNVGHLKLKQVEC